MSDSNEQKNNKRASPEKGQVIVAEHNKRLARTIYTGDHQWLADETSPMGGDDLGPSPTEILLAALGACTSMTLRLYANRKQWPLDDIQVNLTHKRELNDAGETAELFYRVIALTGNDLTDEQRQRLLEIANKCPVHKILMGKIMIETELH